MNVGYNIKQLRTQKNMTQEQVAERLGVTCQAISKWENNANTPDIAMLPLIADLFGVSVDALLSDNVMDYSDIYSFMRDDDVIRVVQMQGAKILKVSPVYNKGDRPIEIAFPKNCNDSTQYFRVEVYGHVVTDGSINGDVIGHQNIECGSINGDVTAEGNVKAGEIASVRVVCNNVVDCYKMEARTVNCRGKINAVNLTCDKIGYEGESFF